MTTAEKVPAHLVGDLGVYDPTLAVPGDVVDVQLTKSKKDWAEGRAIRFHSYSAERAEPFCSHFGVCGGCQWQMLPYEKQLEYKQRQVHDNLKRIGKVALPEMLPIAGAVQTKYYRNKIEYTFGNKRFLKKEELNDPNISSEANVAGFHAKGMFDKIVDIKTCYLQGEPTNAVRLAVKEFALQHELSFYDIRNHAGFLRTMQVRLCNTGELMVNIVFGEEQEENRVALLEYLRKQFPEITTLLYTINTKRNDSLHDLEPVTYFGKGYVIENLEDYQFKIGPKSFFQTNTRQGERLYQITRDFAELTGEEVVYDLYCGTGSIGIFVSDKAKKIIGVEMIAAAIDDAKENAALNKLQDAEFYAGDVIDICNDDFFAAHGKPDVIITDPPRAGTPLTAVNSRALSNCQMSWPLPEDVARIMPSRAPESSAPGISVTAPTTPSVRRRARRSGRSGASSISAPTRASS